MTMRTWGRVVPFGVADIAAGTTVMFIATLNSFPSEVARDAQPLEGIFGFVIERPACAFRHLGAIQLDENFFDVRCGRSHGMGDVGITQRAIALAILGEIQRNDRDIFALRISPDVGLGPMQDRMHPQMRARWPRGENTRSFARVASSSRRMPAINPSKPYLASASFNPSVLRAADRAAGGKVGSMVSSGGEGSMRRSSSHSLP